MILGKSSLIIVLKVNETKYYSLNFSEKSRNEGFICGKMTLPHLLERRDCITISYPFLSPGKKHSKEGPTLYRSPGTHGPLL